MTETITYKMDLDGVDWTEMQSTLVADDFHNGRTVEQYERSFRNSAVTCIAYAGERIIGTVRALSDGVCNAYIVDVWTYTPYRQQGIARRMMELVVERLQGQHVYLWTDDMMDFYDKIGFERDGAAGYFKVIGSWLKN